MEKRPDGAAAAAPPLKKDRHIVSWTAQEDEILRDQVGIQGTENWTAIAAQFKDKTGRQCRRRWYTYLNTECKKGGWSPEEDRILCEAQKIFGNRWTEIAKVVSGRTDNAVKNRFSTLCKKRSKHESLSKENNSSVTNTNNKRAITQNGITARTEDTSAPVKQIRYHFIENCNPNERFPRRHEVEEVRLRPPLTVLVQNYNSAGGLPTKNPLNNNSKNTAYDVSNNKIQGTFLRRDDPKLTALLQQAELLSSLALKVNSENSNQSLEDAWKELQDYLKQNGDSGLLTGRISGMDMLLDDFKDLMEDLRTDASEQQSMRQPDLHEESQGSSECSNGSTQHTEAPKNDKYQCEGSLLNHSAAISCPDENESCLNTTFCQMGVSSFCEEPKVVDENVCTIPVEECSSPLQTVPPFTSFIEEIPSPKFSASERQFLLSVLGMSSPSPSSSSTQPPACKRVLLDSL